MKFPNHALTLAVTFAVVAGAVLLPVAQGQGFTVEYTKQSWQLNRERYASSIKCDESVMLKNETLALDAACDQQLPVDGVFTGCPSNCVEYVKKITPSCFRSFVEAFNKDHLAMAATLEENKKLTPADITYLQKFSDLRFLVNPNAPAFDVATVIATNKTTEVARLKGSAKYSQDFLKYCGDASGPAAAPTSAAVSQVFSTAVLMAVAILYALMS